MHGGESILSVHNDSLLVSAGTTFTSQTRISIAKLQIQVLGSELATRSKEKAEYSFAGLHSSSSLFRSATDFRVWQF